MNFCKVNCEFPHSSRKQSLNRTSNLTELGIAFGEI